MSDFQIQTGARLHFGLLDVAPPFGGIGMMVQHPSTVLRFSSANEFIIDSQIENRVKPIAERIFGQLKLRAEPALKIELLQSPEEHAGFGSGTQVSLAIAEGICRWLNQTSQFDVTLAKQLANRGHRSAVGCHGYFRGGLIYESLTQPNDEINSVRKRVFLADHWRVVVTLPRQSLPGVTGKGERQHFESVQESRSVSTQSLAAIIEDEMIPAAECEDIVSFGDALARYNYRSGLQFADAQGGAYNGEQVESNIQLMRDLDLHGVGQSSWGPAVFGFCENETLAERAVADLRSSGREAFFTSSRNDGRSLVFKS